MMSKITGWIRTTSLWINIAIICTVFFPPLIIFNLLGVGPLNNKALAFFNLMMCVILTLRYGLLKNLQGWFILFFMSWMVGTNLYSGADATKSLGCLLCRMWYICLLVYMVAYIVKDKVRYKWLVSMLGLTSLTASGAFVIILVKSTLQLVDISSKSDMLWGQIMNGRLNGMSNSNILGDTAVAILASAVWLFSLLKNSREEAKTHSLCKIIINIVSITSGLLSVLILSLSKSRGAIASAVIALGILSWFLIKDNKYIILKKMIFSMGMVTALCLLLAIIPKIYNFSVLKCVEGRFGLESERYITVHEKLIPTGEQTDWTSLTDRPLIWHAVINMLDEEPKWWITGITAAKSSEIYIRDIYYQRPDKIALHAHNGYIEVLYLYGIPGAIILGAILFVWLRSGLKIFFDKNESSSVRGLVAFAVAALAVGFVEIYPFPFNQLYLLCYFTFMTAGICERRCEDKNEND